jgi:pimeloyl-ACP methyl ester carboxylesterase
MRETEFDGRGSFVRWSDMPGRSPARVFIHGMGGSGFAAFGHIAGHPALGSHRSIIVDLPGHGLSDRPADWGYSLEDHAAAVAKVCADARVDAIDLVGHSLGGDVAVTVAGTSHGLVGRLVIAEANLDPLPASATAVRASQRIAAQTEEAFLATGYAALLNAYPTWAPMLRLCDARTVYRSAVGLVTGTRPTMREVFMGLKRPRTFIHADRGEPLLDAEGLRTAGVRMVTIADAGHVMMDDQPMAFVEALGTALSD